MFFQIFDNNYNSRSCFIFPLCTDTKMTLEPPNVTVRSMSCSFGFCVHVCVLKTNKKYIKDKPHKL